MAQKWTASRNELLLLLLIDQVKVDGKALAAAWKTKYNDTGVDDYKPTERAIKEHIGALKKSSGGGSATPRPKATPRKAAPKTPKSSGKRKRASKDSDDDEEDIMMDGEDDTDAERKMLKSSPSASRSTLSRRSKSVAKSYANDDSSDEDGFDGENDDAAHTPVATAGAADDQHDGTSFDGAAETAQLNERVGHMGVDGGNGASSNNNLTPQSKTTTNGTVPKSASKRVKREVNEDDSDASEFTPAF